MGGHEHKPIEIPTKEISREALFDLKRANGTFFSRAMRVVGKVTHKINPFPLPGLAGTRLAHFRGDPANSLVKHMVLGTSVGIVLGGIWRYYYINVFNAKRDDYYKQLAIANAKENEKFRNILVEEAKNVSVYKRYFIFKKPYSFYYFNREEKPNKFKSFTFTTKTMISFTQ